nr:putative ribonuclease H-like domain-containing protein [Tanacetum cinerariifolium]
MGKSKKKSHKPKSEDTNQEKLYLLHMDLCRPMHVESVNGKKYILVIVDDYSRFTWVKCLRSKDEATDFIIKFLKMIQVRLKVPVHRIRTDNETEFVNQTLREYYKEVGISHETLVARSPQQNGVVERRNRMLIEAARNIENLGKLQPKADIGIFIGYAPTKKAFWIYNRRTKRLVETNHVDFDELTAMASEQSSSGPALNEMTHATISLGLVQKPSFSTHIVDPQAPGVIAPIAYVIPPVQAESTGSPSSTTVDQDAPSQIAHMGNAPLFGVPIPKVTYAHSSSMKLCKKSSISSNALRLEAIRTFLAYAAYKNMVVYQMDVKTAFLNVDTPMVEKSKLDEDKKGKAVDPSHYHGMIGTLLYLTASRPDLKFAICMCARTMDTIIDQQVEMDEAFVPHAHRLRIKRSNFFLLSDISSKEYTLQLVYDVLCLTPFFKAFLVIAGVPKIYMQEFWATSNVHHHSIRFKMDNKNHIVNLESFREMLHICLRLHVQSFVKPPFEEKILAFLWFLGHSGAIRRLTDVELKDTKKSNEMYYPRFKKFGAMLPIKLTNADIRNSNAYKEYYAVATGATPPKPKASVRKTRSSSDTTVTPPSTVATGPRLTTSEKGKQAAKASKAKRDDDDEQDDDDQEDEGDDDEDDQEEGSDNEQASDEEAFIHPSLSTHAEEEQETRKVLIPYRKHLKTLMMKAMMDVQTPTSVAPLPMSTPTLTPSTIATITITQQAPTPPTTTPSTILQDLPNFGSLFGFDNRLKTLEANFSEFMQTNQFAGAISFIPRIVQRYMDQQMNEVVKVAVQIQSDHLRDEAQADYDEFLKTIDENIQTIIKERVKKQVKVQVSKILPKIGQTVNEQLEAEVLIRSSDSSKTSYAVAADLSEMELKKILIGKIEGNKSTHRSNKQRNLYKALRSRNDDADKDKEPSTGSDRGSKRRREGKEPESASAPKEKATRKEPMQTTFEMEEPSHPEFETGVDDQPIVEPSQHPEWFSQQKKPQTLDRDWNKTLPATHRSIQPWIIELVKQSDSRYSFNELMDTLVDFTNFLMNRLKVNTLTSELLAGPTYELMKGSCKILVELELFLEEVYNATTDQLDWVNSEGQQYPHNLLKPLPLIPNSRGHRVIPFDHFINNNLKYLRGGASSRKYTTSVSKTKAEDYGHIKWIEDLRRKRQQFYGFAVNRESARDVYSKRRIIAVTELKIVEWHNYKHLDWIMVRRNDDKLYKFKEGDFKRLRIQEIEDMRVEDLQLGVKSYQKKLTLTRLYTYRFDLKRKEAYSAYSNPRGFIYQNKDKQNRLMWIDELHKFSDGTLTDVRIALDDRLKGIRMKYLPKLIWRKSDKDRATAMIHAIDKVLKTRRIMRSLERFVGNGDDDDDEQDDDDAQDDDDQEDEGDDDEDDQEEGSDDEEECIHPSLSTHAEEETRDEESFDPIPKTPENTNDEGNGEENIRKNVCREERHDEEEEEEELYRDVNINLRRGMESIFETTSQMDVQTPTSVAHLPISAPTLTPSTVATITTTIQATTPPRIAPSTLLQDLSNFGFLFRFDHRLKTLEANFSEFIQTNQFTRSVSSILKIAQGENAEFLKTIDENMQKIIKEQVKEQVKFLTGGGNVSSSTDLQLGVESYQKRLNLTKLDTYRSDLKRQEAYTAYSNPIGFIYQNKDKKNRLMQIDKLHKFSDGTLNDVHNALDDRLKGIRM